MSVGHYRKRPVVIEAIQYIPPTDDQSDSGNAGEVTRWADGGTCTVVMPTGHWGETGHPQCWDLIIATLEDGSKPGCHTPDCAEDCTDTHSDGVHAEHIASPFDWIVKGIQGEFYAVKPDIFAACYEAVDA